MRMEMGESSRSSFQNWAIQITDLESQMDSPVAFFFAWIHLTSSKYQGPAPFSALGKF